MKPTLVILAAGVGRRFGGLKQLVPVGPGGEAVLDYSMYDAVRAGFGRVVLVIRRETEGERCDLPEKPDPAPSRFVSRDRGPSGRWTGS